MDIAAAADVTFKVTWYKNTNGVFSSDITIATYASAIGFVMAADFNNDGWDYVTKVNKVLGRNVVY